MVSKIWNRMDYYKLGIIVIVIAAIIRLIFALTHSVSGDACWHLSAARFMAGENSIPLYDGLGRLQPFWAPPVFHFVAAFFYKIFMPVSLDLAGAGMKLVSPIFGTLSVILLFLLSRRLFNDKIAFYSILFLNFIPVFMDYSMFSFIESTVTFFSLLSVYLMLKGRYILSSVSLGFALLSKYNAAFMLPMLLYLAYKMGKERKDTMIRMATVAILPLAISSVWFIRNWVLLGNPVWPFLNGIFKGATIGTTFDTLNFWNIFNLSTYKEMYLELFGVPGGDINTLSFANIPFMGFFLLAWLIATAVFIFPLARGFFFIKTHENRDFFRSIYMLLISFFVMFLLYIFSLDWFNPRLLLPIMPFMAIIWAIGLGSVKTPKLEKIYLIVIILISFGFVFSQAIKLNIASDEWKKYDADFQWAGENTPKNSVFFGNGQCLHYHISRMVVDQNDYASSGKADYVWVNNEWRIDFLFDEDTLKKIENDGSLKQAYENKETGTIIYSRQ